MTLESTEPLASWTPRRLALFAFATSLLTALICRGRVHPDEVFQVLEPAHRTVFGYGVVAWEWKDGLRNRAVVDIVAAVLRALAAVHLDRPTIAVTVVWALCSVWQAVGVVALYRLIEERDGASPARLACLLLATWGGYLIYAARPLGDALALPALLLALRYVQRAGGAADGFFAGAALGAAVIARYPSLVFAAPLGLGALASRKASVVAGFLLGFGLLLAGLGLLDYASWGEAFHSFRKYAAFNQPSGQVVASFGKEPWWWYLPMFGALAPYFLAWQFGRGLRTHLLAAGAFFTYLILVDLHPHKEERFLLPLVPLGLIIAAPAAWLDLQRVRARGGRWLGALLAVYAVWSLISLTVMRPFDLGRDEIEADAFLAREPDLRGVLLIGEWWSCGGFFYLHRDVPMPIGSANDPRLAPEREADSSMSHILAVGQKSRYPEWEAKGWHLAWSRGDASVWKRNPVTAR